MRWRICSHQQHPRVFVAGSRESHKHFLLCRYCITRARFYPSRAQVFSQKCHMGRVRLITAITNQSLPYIRCGAVLHHGIATELAIQRYGVGIHEYTTDYSMMNLAIPPNFLPLFQTRCQLATRGNQSAATTATETGETGETVETATAAMVPQWVVVPVLRQ